VLRPNRQRATTPTVDEDPWDDDSVDAQTRRPEYLERNQAAWRRWAGASAGTGARAWRTDELRWGLWNTPESQLHLLQDVAQGSDAIELGCGAGALCGWLRRMGMFPVGLDFSPTHLDVARQLQQELDVRFPLISGSAEEIPIDQDSFDLVISEYGASVWSNPRRWLPEAHRVLRPGGRLIFFTNAAMLMACTPQDGSQPTDRLVRSYFSTYRIEFGEDAGVEFHLAHGQWVRVLRATGFAIENLIEFRPPEDAVPRYEQVPLDWARQWPSEEIWVARKVSAREPGLGSEATDTGRWHAGEQVRYLVSDSPSR
jgi:SAM-dependent methyltransferase